MTDNLEPLRDRDSLLEGGGELAGRVAQTIDNTQQGKLTWTRREIDALMRVSRAVALHEDLAGLLEFLAKEASSLTHSDGCSIMLREPGGSLALAAANGLGSDYTDFLRGRLIRFGPNVGREVVDSVEPAVVRNVADHTLYHRFPELLASARQEGYSALLSVPLVATSRTLGALTVYRVEQSDWSRSEVEFMSVLGQHVAGAIEQGRLIHSERRQVDALERLVSVLRDQTHEYANRLHAISGLLALGEAREAQQFLSQLIALHHDSYSSVVERIRDPTLAGLLVAQIGIGRQRGVDVHLHGSSRIETLPAGVSRSEVVTIVANLVQNAIDATVSQPARQRRVSIRLSQIDHVVKLTIRDWGEGIDESKVSEMFARGVSGKEDHAGIGLALVAGAVDNLEGEITVEPQPVGTMFRVSIPVGEPV